ncbi:MAG: hypothetical protein F6K54_06975 [Okeania sp. SIO3B5]|nr:hypothetical protein [Okeania sp. SIO3B5]NEO52846.1 hypothetical protein [Okeania sp. SIO3B5]
MTSFPVNVSRLNKFSTNFYDTALIDIYLQETMISYSSSPSGILEICKR